MPGKRKTRSIPSAKQAQQCFDRGFEAEEIKDFLFAREQYLRAVQLLEGSANINPLLDVAQWNLGRVMFELGEVVDGFKHLQAVRTRSPNDFRKPDLELYKAAAIIAKADITEESKESKTESVKVKPKKPRKELVSPIMEPDNFMLQLKRQGEEFNELYNLLNNKNLTHDQLMKIIKMTSVCADDLKKKNMDPYNASGNNPGELSALSLVYNVQKKLEFEFPHVGAAMSQMYKDLSELSIDT